MRRRYRWEQVAAMARSAPGVWRQHADLIAVTEHTYRHVRRRVAALQSDAGGRFRFRRGVVAKDGLGRTIFDLRVMYETRNTDVNEGSQGAEEAAAKPAHVRPERGGREAEADEADQGAHPPIHPEG